MCNRHDSGNETGATMNGDEANATRSGDQNCDESGDTVEATAVVDVGNDPIDVDDATPFASCV